MQDEARRVIKNELYGQPVDYEFGHGGKHPFVRITNAHGATTKIPFASSPSGCNLKSVRADVRRTLRGWGLSRVGDLGQKLAEAKETQKDTPMATEFSEQLKPRVLPDLSKPTNGSAGAHTTKSAPADSGEPDKEASVRLTQKEIILYSEIMHNHATVDRERDLVIYSKDWSDERALEFLKKTGGREGLSLKQLRDLRREHYGLVTGEYRRMPSSKIAKGPSGQYKNLKATVDALMKRVTDLENLLNLYTSPNKKIV